MPGSIQVSVLDVKELPSSSSFVKVSLGKVEHEAVEKGIFTFPLTNLRDNLMITVQDSEGNQVSHSGVQTKSIIEKGTWDDVFPIEGGGLIHMKLQFVLSDEERNRIRLMREAAMKKKQAEILASRLRNAESAKSLASSLSIHEVSDVLRATSSQDFKKSDLNSNDAKDGLLTLLNDVSVKASESSDEIKEESFQRQSFTVKNATDKSEEISFSRTREESDKTVMLDDTDNRASQNSPGTTVEKLYEPNLDEEIRSDAKKTNKDNTSTILLQETEVDSNKNKEIPLHENLPEDTETREFVKKNNETKSRPLDNLLEKLEKQNLEEKESKDPPLSQEIQIETVKNNEIQLQQPDETKRLQNASRSIIAENIKSFSTKVGGEADKQGTLEKTERNIKKMISVFESSSISQDRVPLKPTKSYKVGTFPLFKDNPVKGYFEKPESSLMNSKTSSSTRLRNSFSMSDLRKNISSIITKDNDFLQPEVTNMQSKENDAMGTGKSPKDFNTVASIGVKNEEKIAFVETNKKKVPESIEDDARRMPPEVTNMQLKENDPKGMEKSPKDFITVASIGVNNEETIASVETNKKKVLESIEDDSKVSGRMPLEVTNVQSKENDPKGISRLPKDFITVENIGVNNEEKIAFIESNKKKVPESIEDDAKAFGRMPAEVTNVQPKENDPKGISKLPKDFITVKNIGVKNEEKIAFEETNKKKVSESIEDDATVSGRLLLEDNKDAEKDEGDRAVSLLEDCKIEEKDHQENTVASMPELVVKGDGIVKEGEEMGRVSGNSSPKGTDEEACNGSFGQAIKIALVVGFGVLVLLFQQRERGKGKKKENALKNQVLMNKRGPIEEQRLKIRVLKLS